MKKLNFILLVFISILFAQNYCAYGCFTDHDYDKWGGTYLKSDIYHKNNSTIDKVKLKVQVLPYAIPFGDAPNSWAVSSAYLAEGGQFVTEVIAEQYYEAGTDTDEWIKPGGHPGCDEVIYVLKGESECKYYVPPGVPMYYWICTRADSWVYIWE